jgi:hypothetical protein
MQMNEVSFDSAIETLKANGAKFTQVYRDFINAGYYAKQDPKLYQEWLAVKSKADSVKNTIIYINNAVEGSISWLGSTFGLNGMNIVNQIPKQNLGVLPLLPVAYVLGASAAVVGAITLMTNSIGNIYEYKRKADLVESGQADSDILNQENPNTLSYQLSSVLKFGLILGAAYFIIPKLLKKS